jgi:hypothetical protein
MGKSKHKITSWSQYNKALVNRGFLPFWIGEQAIKACDVPNIMVALDEDIYFDVV